ncbi:MAG: NUDIX domain-containing protein [Candidatus Latescibacteria bacterium]|jgi:8-oxo-dGTP pyrophosphatase MutT (NUDIX family)|nr:NUDIX domain-containing protein [Candidatus Latescibacterota bacterium]
MQILEATPNRFKGIELDADALPNDPEEFRVRLSDSLREWKREGFKVVWINVPIGHAVLIPIATEAGFSFHHSGQDYLLLTKRLEADALIPEYATHYIGAGGVVINDREELLVVSELHRRSESPYYKLPGGALHAGEHIADCVQREVLEETGVRTKFEKLVCFRHWHGYRYEKSDIYFVCRLSPLSEDISIQAEEIEECLWLPVTNYLASESVSVFNKHIVKAALESPGVTHMEIEGYSNPERHEIFMPDGMEHIE